MILQYTKCECLLLMMIKIREFCLFDSSFFFHLTTRIYQDQDQDHLVPAFYHRRLPFRVPPAAMNSRYVYDEKSETWPVFALAVLSVTVVPVSLASLYSLLTNKGGGAGQEGGSVKGAISTDSALVPQTVKQYRQKSRRGKLLTKRFILLLLGWLSIGALIYHVKTHEIEAVSNNFDPYEILGIDFGSTEKEIKSHFRRLSVKFHPDKMKSDATEEEKLEIEDRFVLISKAYKALTDETVKENYEKYGHPDGPQETTHGIALPKFLIEGQWSSPVLLVLYILLIGLVLPSIVSNWWNSTKAYTKKGIHNDTAALFTEKLLNYNPSKIMKISTILQWLSETHELKEFGTKAEILNVFDKYLGREELSIDELSLISKVSKILLGLIDISATFRNPDVSMIAVQTHRHFMQALKESNQNDLLQLPNVDQESVKSSKIRKLGKLFTLSESEIKKTIGIKSETELKQTLSVASKIPNLQLLKAEFKVPGESVVTPGSNCYISVKFLVKSPRHHGDSKIDDEKLKEIDTMETLRNPYKIVSDQPLLPINYSLYSPILKRSTYIAFVFLQKDGKIAEIPSIFENLDLSNLELTQDEFKSGEKVEVGTFKIPISQPTPNEVGEYQFRVVVKSLDYFANDIDTTVIMKVQEPPKIEEIDTDNYEIPDPDEDSFAGALASMKGEKVKKINNDSDDDEEDSDIEEEEEEDFTDINTDTEDESEK